MVENKAGANRKPVNVRVRRKQKKNNILFKIFEFEINSGVCVISCFLSLARTDPWPPWLMIPCVLSNFFRQNAKGVHAEFIVMFFCLIWRGPNCYDCRTDWDGHPSDEEEYDECALWIHRDPGSHTEVDAGRQRIIPVWVAPNKHHGHEIDFDRKFWTVGSILLKIMQTMGFFKIQITFNSGSDYGKYACEADNGVGNAARALLQVVEAGRRSTDKFFVA